MYSGGWGVIGGWDNLLGIISGGSSYPLYLKSIMVVLWWGVNRGWRYIVLAMYSGVDV